MIATLICFLTYSDSSHAVRFTGSCPTSHPMNMGNAGGLDNAAQTLADAECSNCHGIDGNGIKQDDDVPYLAGQEFAYLCAWLDQCRTQGKDCESHEDIAAQLSDRDIVGLALFYSHQPSKLRMPK